MNASIFHRAGSGTACSNHMSANLVPVTQLCEIACIILCRIVVPKLARSVNLAG